MFLYAGRLVPIFRRKYENQIKIKKVICLFKASYYAIHWAANFQIMYVKTAFKWKSQLYIDGYLYVLRMHT